LGKRNGDCSCLGGRLRPGVEREQVWNIGEDITSKDAVEYTGILEEFWDVFA
jgi:hypothetical protein